VKTTTVLDLSQGGPHLEQFVRIRSYDPATGLHLEWSYGFQIEVQVHSGEVLVRANKAGLTSLAQHLLTLAEDAVPGGTHIHLDAARDLEDTSANLVIERAACRQGPHDASSPELAQPSTQATRKRSESTGLPAERATGIEPA
jgi:hypothetical protein